MRKLILAAAALASLAPVAASAQPGYGRGNYGGGYGNYGGYEQNYRGDPRERVRECFRSVRFANNRWEAERRRDHCQRLAERLRNGRGYGGGYGYDDRGRGRGW